MGRFKKMEYRYYEADVFEVIDETHEKRLIDDYVNELNCQDLDGNPDPLSRPVNSLAKHVLEAIRFRDLGGEVDICYNGQIVTAIAGHTFWTFPMEDLRYLYDMVNRMDKVVLDLELEDYTDSRIFLRRIRFSPGISSGGNAVAKLTLIGV